MGITAASVHLPALTLDDKTLSQTAHGRGHTRLRVPGWDEAPLTMAVEAALGLGDELDGTAEVHLALDEAVDQPGLALTALDLEDALLVEHTGPGAGLAALLSVDDDRPALVLAGGARLGGAGVALVLTPERGVPLEAHEARSTAPLSRTGAGPAGDLLEALGKGDVLVPLAGLPRRQRRGLDVATEVGTSVGDAGAAGALLELAYHLGRHDAPRRIAAPASGQWLGARLGPGQLDVAGLDAPSEPLTVEAWQRLQEPQGPPWADAAQGAYVSAEVYDADPRARYGARSLGPATVEAVTTIQAGPPGEFQRQHQAAGPYDVAIVTLADGSRRTTQVAGPPGRVAIGDQLRPVLRRLFHQEGRWRYAVKWRR